MTDDNGMEHDRKGLFTSKGHGGGASGKGADRKPLSPTDIGMMFAQALKKKSAEKPTIGSVSPSFKNDSAIPSVQHHKPYLGYTGGTHAFTPPPPPKGPFRLPPMKGPLPDKKTANYTDKSGKVHDTRVDNVTNHPVSAEYEDAINRLYQGEDIPPDDLEKTIPELKNEKELAKAYTTLDRFMHPEDYKDADEKLNDIYKQFSSDTITSETNEALPPGASYKVKQGKELWLVTGLPGAGKSTSFVNPISVANGARVVDSDAIKEKMPGFCMGLGAPNVHEKSKSINDKILAESLSRGDNIVYPVLGYNAEYVGNQIESIRRKGYKVHLILNELPFPMAMARCLERRLKTGRNIPLDMFRKVGDRPSEAYEKLKTMVDTYEKHTGDAVTRKCVEKGENKDLPPPARKPTYSYHGMPLGNYQPKAVSEHGDVSFPKHTSDPKWHETFKVKQKKPMYWDHSWFGKHGKDEAMDSAYAVNGAAGVRTDRFGNVILASIQNRQTRKTAAPGRPEMTAIPDAFDGEIEGRETAHDLARFHYLMSGEDAEG